VIAVAQIRVLYADTDQMGMVNNVQYLRWFEIGRAEWIRLQGVSYKDIEASGWYLPVVEAHLEYRAPARYDDLIDIAATPDDLRAATVRFTYEIRRSEDSVLLCEGFTRHACVDEQGRPRRFPEELLALLRPET
jgi:acyl-CoA thioester hydrolase